MARFSHHDFTDFWRRCSRLCLALIWIFGLIAGCILFFSAEPEFSSLMPMAVGGRVSIVGLLSVILLPFLFSAFAVFISQSWLLLPLAFCKAVCFSYVSLGVMEAYGSAGWLMRLLLMFSDIAVLPLLYGYWQRYISGDRQFGIWPGLLFLVGGLCIGSMDYCLISPFLAGL